MQVPPAAGPTRRVPPSPFLKSQRKNVRREEGGGFGSKLCLGSLGLEVLRVYEMVFCFGLGLWASPEEGA